MTDDAFKTELNLRYDAHARHASAPVYARLESVWPYYETNYRSLVDRLSRSTNVLEIGPGHGSLLAWLRSLGFENLAGVDASPGDVRFANEHLGGDVVVHGDAFEYLTSHRARFGLIVMKAVLEHLPRSRLIEAVRDAASALAEDGVLLVDVPNMDWLMASHERYMDLTHETGVTRESLRALLGLVFNTVEVSGSRLPKPTRSQRFLRRPVIALLRRILYILGEGASDVLFESRSLVATAKHPLVSP